MANIWSEQKALIVMQDMEEGKTFLEAADAQGFDITDERLEFQFKEYVRRHDLAKVDPRVYGIIFLKIKGIEEDKILRILRLSQATYEFCLRKWSEAANEQKARYKEAWETRGTSRKVNVPMNITDEDLELISSMSNLQREMIEEYAKVGVTSKDMASRFFTTPEKLDRFMELLGISVFTGDSPHREFLRKKLIDELQREARRMRGETTIEDKEREYNMLLDAAEAHHRQFKAICRDAEAYADTQYPLVAENRSKYSASVLRMCYDMCKQGGVKVRICKAIGVDARFALQYGKWKSLVDDIERSKRQEAFFAWKRKNGRRGYGE